MEYRAVSKQIARDFQENPINYVAEADLQTALVEELRAQLSPVEASVADVGLEGISTDSFKRDYWQAVQQKMSNAGQLNRVHTEVSVRKGERLDVAVFNSELTHPIEWVSGGSKRFSVEDVDCAYEIKFVKNKTSFPKHTGHPISDLADEDPSIEYLLQRAKSDDPILDFEENKIRSDIHELNRLKTVNARFLLLFSNNNYLYHDPTSTEFDDYRYGDIYYRMGNAAREWMTAEAQDGVEILYVHPRGMVWLTENS